MKEDLAKDPKVIKTSNLTHITIVDPARTVKLQSAESGIITVGISRQSRGIFVRKAVGKKFYPDELYNEMFLQITQYKSYILGVDTVGLSNFVTQPIENEFRVRNIFPTLIELPAKKSKELRVAALGPQYKLGYIYHSMEPNSGCSRLEMQLLGFPRSKYWDIMDSLAYIPYIMDKHAIFFEPDDFDDADPPEEDFDDLHNDKMLDELEMGFTI